MNASSSSKDQNGEKGKVNKPSQSKGKASCVQVSSASSSKAATPANSKAATPSNSKAPTPSNSKVGAGGKPSLLSSSAASACAAMLKTPQGVIIPKQPVVNSIPPTINSGTVAKNDTEDVKNLADKVKEQNEKVRNMMDLMHTFMNKVNQPDCIQPISLDGSNRQLDLLESSQDSFVNEDFQQFDNIDEEWEQNSHQGDDGSEDEGESVRGGSGSVMDRFAPPKSQFVPSELNLQLWDRVTKLSAGYNDEDWRKFSTNSTIKKWSGGSQAMVFSSQKPDPGLVDLHFQDQKDLEKQLVAAQKAAGAIGAVTTKMLEAMEG